MNELEDLLVRTLRDPARALPAPADPMAAVRARARAQRRTAALAVVAVLVALAAVVVPTAVLRTDRALPPAGGAGVLDWGPRGPRADDPDRIAAAERVAREVPDPRPDALSVLWADDTTVLFAGRDRENRPFLVRITGTDVQAQLVLDPGVVAVRLTDRALSDSLVLVRPGGTLLRLLPTAELAETADYPVQDGVARIPADDAGLIDERYVSVLDAAGTVLGQGVGASGLLVLPRGDERPAAPTWRQHADTGHPDELHARGGYLAARLGSWPVEIATIADSSDAGSDVLMEPRVYEVRRDGRVWLTSAVWVGGTPYCPRAEEITGRVAAVRAYVVRCWVPPIRDGLVYTVLDDGVRLANLVITPGGPGQVTLSDGGAPVEAGVMHVIGDGFPTGPGRLTLVDAGGKALPPVELPAYS